MKERFKRLFLASAILFSFYYAYDIPAALNESILFSGKFSASKLTLLYSAYAFPNIFTPILFRCDSKISERLLTVIVSACVCVGQMVFFWGLFLQNFLMMMMGRFIFGVGCETFVVIQNKRLSKLFQGKELAFSLSFFISIGRFGTVMTFLITPLVNISHGSIIAVFIATILVIVGFALTMVLVRNKKESFSVPLNSVVERSEEQIVETVRIATEVKEHPVDPLRNSWDVQSPSPQSSIRFEALQIPMDDDNVWSNIIKEKEEEFRETIDEREPAKNGIKPAFYILLAIAMLFGAVWAPFYNIAALMFQKRYSVSQIRAGQLMAIVEGVSMFLTTIVGLIVDKVGKKLYFIALGGIMLSLSHLLIVLRVLNPLFCSILLGLSGPFISSYWPCTVFLVSSENLSFAFALLSSGINFAYFLSPIFLGITVAYDPKYGISEIFLFGISIIALTMVFLLKFYNKKQHLGLNEKKNIQESN